MLDQLHNDLFSQSKCLSKKQIDDYLSGKISDSERFDIEKHLIDCPLCNEAIEGFSEVPFTISLNSLDAEIDKKTTNIETRKKRFYFSIAATITILLLGTWLLSRNVSDTKSISIAEEKTSANIVIEEDKSTSIAIKPESTEEISNVEQEKSFDIDNKNNKKVSIQQENEPESNDSPLKTETIALTKGLSENIAEEETIINDAPSTSSMTYKSEPSVANTSAETDEAELSENLTATNKLETSKKSKTKRISKNKMLTKYINGLKVYDYSQQYESQEFYTVNVEQLSVSAAYENSNDIDKFDSLDLKTITYNELLEKGIQNIKNKHYKNAISDFSKIEKKHPDDVNAQFYKAISYQNLGKHKKALVYFEKVLQNSVTVFNEEAEFHKAETLLKLGKKSTAKKLLKKIAASDSYYKQQAENLLKNL